MFGFVIIILLLIIVIGYAAASVIANRKHLDKQMNPRKKYKKKSTLFDTKDRNNDGGDN